MNANPKKMQKSATLPPKRSSTHQIDTMAVRYVRTQLSADLIERDMQDRDYGVDMFLEVFEQDSPTGSLVLLQIKGHEAAFPEPVQYQVPVKTLLYAQMFATPFFLVTVSLEDQNARYVWLQKYIKTKLKLENQEWRSKETVQIAFPSENVLDTNGLKRIRLLAQHYARRDIGLQFLNHLAWLRRHIGDANITGALERSKQIRDLPEEFVETYAQFLPDIDLELVPRLLNKVAQYSEYGFEGLDDEEHQELDTQLDQLAQMQTLFLSGDEFDEFLVEATGESSPY